MKMKASDTITDSDKGNVLITGGSGLIGRHLTSLLMEKGYSVSHLSRKANLFGKVRVYRWNPSEKILNTEIFEGVDYFIHLAGANLGEKRWTKKRKEELIYSRVETAVFLQDIITKNNIRLKESWISPSKIISAGFDFTFKSLPEALKDISGS